MNANELRIGNLIKYISTGKIEEVKDIITYDKRQANINNVNISDCEPIELTEEWLIKFGFQYGFGKTEKLYLSIPCIEFYLWGNKIDNFSSCTLIINKSNEITIKYVHQLQNLYFALTETELTINQ